MSTYIDFFRHVFSIYQIKNKKIYSSSSKNQNKSCFFLFELILCIFAFRLHKKVIKTFENFFLKNGWLEKKTSCKNKKTNYILCIQNKQRHHIWCFNYYYKFVMAIYKVKKRNGTIVTFDKSKIAQAIQKAISSV